MTKTLKDYIKKNKKNKSILHNLDKLKINNKKIPFHYKSGKEFNN